MRRFYHNAKLGNNSLISYILTIVITFFGYFLGQVPMTVAIMWKMNKYPDIGTEALSRFKENPDFTIFHMDKNLGLVLVLMTFVVAFTFLVLSVRYIHKRNPLTLVSTGGRIDFRRLAWGTAVWLGLLVLAEVVYYFFHPSNYTFHAPGLSFLWLVLISVTLLPVQVIFEEIFTRGYLYQAVAYNTKNVFFGFLVSVIVFAALHSFNPETLKYGLMPMMTYYISAGILLGLIVVFDDRLELAIAVHYATNLFGAVLLTYDGAAMQTDALFITKTVDPVFLAGEMIILGAIFLFIAYRKYKWKPLKVKMRYEEEEIEFAGE